MLRRPETKVPNPGWGSAWSNTPRVTSGRILASLTQGGEGAQCDRLGNPGGAVVMRLG